MSHTNAISLFAHQAHEHASRMAIWTPGSSVTFSELKALARGVQRIIHRHEIEPGDNVLLVDSLSPRLYGIVIGLLGLGCPVILVEPWMPVARIDKIIQQIRPKAFINNFLGKLWGLRVKSIRSIPHWISASQFFPIHEPGGLEAHLLPAEHPGIITFTSGTTGSPKGLVRAHGYLQEQHRILSKHLGLDQHTGPDLCIFANFALANLASGRGSIVIPPAWSERHLVHANNLPLDFVPETLTCGPAFLKRLSGKNYFPGLKSIHVGGALTDCSLFEQSFLEWPGAHMTHVYGSTEAEPVATVDARIAVAKSRDKGLFQTLYLGTPVSDITARIEGSATWITGPHVAPLYLHNEEENRLNKMTTPDGRIWHNMGDRIRVEDGGWYYWGRSGQDEAEFTLEQKIYPMIGTSAAFVKRDRHNKLWLIGEGVTARQDELKRQFPQIDECVEAKIVRDPRHRARIDRNKTLEEGAKWLVG